MAIYLGNQIVGVNNVTTSSGGGGSSINVSSLNVTTNGTYTASSGSAYSPVTVAVPGKLACSRPEATVIQSYTYDKYLIEDEIISTLPSYSTSAQTLVASAALTPTFTCDVTNYTYFITISTLTIPIYNTDATAKGRQEYYICAAAYEHARVLPNLARAIVDPSKIYTSGLPALVSTTAMARTFYWSGNSSFAGATAAYGCYQTIAAPTLSSGVITVNSPNFLIRGSSTYFTSTYFGALTDIRYQYIINIYRSSKLDTEDDGWSIGSQLNKIVNCAISNTHTLTM